MKGQPASSSREPQEPTRERPGPFVGHGPELDGLTNDLDRVLLGQGQLVLVSGDPGPGKTRFPTEEQLTSLVRRNLSGPRKVQVSTEDRMAPWADQVYQWLTADHLQITRVQELLAARGCEVLTHR